MPVWDAGHRGTAARFLPGTVAGAQRRRPVYSPHDPQHDPSQHRTVPPACSDPGDAAHFGPYLVPAGRCEAHPRIPRSVPPAADSVVWSARAVVVRLCALFTPEFRRIFCIKIFSIAHAVSQLWVPVWVGLLLPLGWHMCTLMLRCIQQSPRSCQADPGSADGWGSG